MIVFVAQVEVAHQDGDLRASQHQNTKDKEQESNAVVNSVEPNAVHDKVKFDKDRTEWKNTTHQDGRDSTQVERLIRDLSRDLVRTDRLLNARLAEPKVRAGNAQRERNDRVQTQDCKHGAKRNSTRRVRSDQEKVQSEQRSEDDARIPG